MRALIIDAGNSRIQGAVWPGNAGLPRLPVQGGPAPAAPLEPVGNWATPKEGDTLPEGLIRTLSEGPHRPVVLASVIPHVTALLLRQRPDLVVVDHRLDLPFPTDVAEPAAVGADRYCNVAAAWAAGLSDALIVDAGTATTFDLLENGVFRGGLIAPGMALAARHLGEAAARLEPVPFEPRDWEVGRDTQSAMAGGAWHVGVGGVEAVIAGLTRRYGPRPVVLTGGLGRFITWDKALWDPDWTLRGAAFLGC